jgi:hypothetical protein
MDGGGGDLDKRNENETALVEAGMRDYQVPALHFSLAVQEHVDVYLSGPPSERDAFPHDFFGFLECPQESLRGHGGADLNNSVQKITLGSIPDRGSVVKKRRPDKGDSGGGGEDPEGAAKIVGPTSAVRPQAEKDTFPSGDREASVSMQ